MAKGSNSAFQRDIDSLLHPYTNLLKHKEQGPLIIEQGQGVFVRDSQGREYLEGMSGLWCASLGFNEEELVQAAAEQMRKLPFAHLFAHKSQLPAIDLAEKLLQMMPMPASKVFFTSSGSEANDTQVKLMWYYNNARGLTKKKKIISRDKAYHGVTVAAASLTGLPVLHQSFDLPIEGIFHTDCPHYYRFAEPGESEQAFVDRILVNLRKLIEQQDPATIAAFIAEPVQGAGGALLPPASYFPQLQTLLKEYDIALIDDEVICGFGRTGNMFGCETFGFQPDTMSLAKSLSAAFLPIGAVVIPQDMYEVIAEESSKRVSFGHGYTYSGHPVCAAVALRTLELYEERNILQHVQQQAPLFLQRLKALQDHDLVGEARGVGLIGACELVADKTSKRNFQAQSAVAAKCAAFAQDFGLIVRAVGQSVAVCPPLIISEAEINLLFDRYEQALDATLHWVKKNDLK